MAIQRRIGVCCAFPLDIRIRRNEFLVKLQRFGRGLAFVGRAHVCPLPHAASLYITRIPIRTTLPNGHRNLTTSIALEAYTIDRSLHCFAGDWEEHAASSSDPTGKLDNDTGVRLLRDSTGDDATIIRLGPENRPVAALAVDLQNPATVYAATRAGLFKSLDEGTTWLATTPGPPCCISTLILDPQTQATLYAVTQIQGASADRRILKTVDGGAHWVPVNQGMPVDSDGHYGVTSLAIDPQNPATLYAGYAGVAAAGAGVFKTSNDGENWQAANSGLPAGDVIAVTVDPRSSGPTRAAGIAACSRARMAGQTGLRSTPASIPTFLWATTT